MSTLKNILTLAGKELRSLLGLPPKQVVDNAEPSALFTKALEIAYETNPPPVVRGHVAKLRFAHPGGSNPPTFIVHGSRLRTLSDTYKRYLENFFRKRFKLVGTPVRFIFKEGENPYKDKKNVLTDRQVAKKRRLIRHVKRKG